MTYRSGCCPGQETRGKKAGERKCEGRPDARTQAFDFPSTVLRWVNEKEGRRKSSEKKERGKMRKNTTRREPSRITVGEAQRSRTLKTERVKRNNDADKVG